MSVIAMPPNAAFRIDGQHRLAAQRLITEVAEKQEEILANLQRLWSIVKEWEEVMRLYRLVEHQIVVEEATKEHLEAFRNGINKMILCADTTVSVCERFMKVNEPIDDADGQRLKSCIAAIHSHRELLEIDYRLWTPTMGPAELDSAMKRFFGEPGRKAC